MSPCQALPSVSPHPKALEESELEDKAKAAKAVEEKAKAAQKAAAKAAKRPAAAAVAPGPTKTRIGVQR